MLISFYCNYGNIIVAGDFNASCLLKDIPHSNIHKSSELLKMIKKHDLLYPGGNIIHIGPCHTFLRKKTLLDYIFIRDRMQRQLRSYEILEAGSLGGTSNYLPIIAEISVTHNPHTVLSPTYKFPAWHKSTDSQIDTYKNCLEIPLSEIINKMECVFFVLRRISFYNCYM